ncbi:MAG: carbohydrate ABC transporter permease [Clostridiales bacterium]|jgi:putative aldouronate transport system permease protein|nr:carbohydrate ABC transporter permease [Clostridiales bacterium]
MENKKRKSRLKRPTIGDWIIVVVMLVLIATCIFPVLNVVATSFSSPSAIMRQQVTLFPKIESVNDEGETEFPVGMRMEAYGDMINNSRFMRSLAWTALLTLISTVISLTMTVLCAYPLTYDKLKGRKIITLLIIFTMYFQAGLIPNYVLFFNLKILNTPLVLILPGMISVFLMIIMRKFFLGIPDSLKESAEIDGASPIKILVRIYLPLSTPALATLGLMYAVGRWNGFTDSLMFITDAAASKWHPIQHLLYNILQGTQGVETNLDPGSANLAHTRSVEAAAIVMAMVPILCVYPWLQKYFVHGVTLGAVKG